MVSAADQHPVLMASLYCRHAGIAAYDRGIVNGIHYYQFYVLFLKICLIGGRNNQDRYPFIAQQITAVQPSVQMQRRIRKLDMQPV